MCFTIAKVVKTVVSACHILGIGSIFLLREVAQTIGLLVSTLCSLPVVQYRPL